MYRYDSIDKAFVADRTAEFREQVGRRLAGEITEDQFKPIRLMNGLYLQLHAYMLRIAIPYGTLNSAKLRRLAHIARTYDKGYGHFTTRTNLQLHWIKLKDAPQILDELAEVGMHAEQVDMLEVEGRKRRLGFAFDLLYLNLDAPVTGADPVLGPLGVSADIRQLVTEGLGFYRVVQGERPDNPSHVDLLFGARYVGTSARLGNDVLQTGKQDLHWVDAVAGLRFRARLGSRVSLLGRGDVAGFGSKFTWNVEGDLAIHLSERWALGAGWRDLDIDYDKGEGSDRKVFDIAFDGPRTWVAYSW